jgi:transposase
MLGRRNPQRDLFGAQNLPHRVPEDSFYGRMAAVSDILFNDDDLQEMYCEDNGRPSLPPSLMCGILMLQFHDDVSDEEARDRAKFDRRWQVALDLPLDFPGFDPSSLSNFRKRLVQHGQERYAFDRFIAVGRAAGFIPDKVTLLTDTTWAKGAGAVQDTYTLLRKGIRKLFRAMGYTMPGKRRGLSSPAQELVVSYLDQDRKADIDWSDPEQRATQLKTLVQDAESALALAQMQNDDADVRSAGWLLTKILGDDVVMDDQGAPQIGVGVATERIISITDSEMRHGHKSKSQRFNGYKVTVSTESIHNFIMDIANVSASGSDGAHLLPAIQRVEEHAGVTVEQVIGDGAYGSGDNLAACATYPAHPIDLLTPTARPKDAAVDKSAFEIDLEKQWATCPQGHTAVVRPNSRGGGRSRLKFTFRRADCEACPLFTRCVRSQKTGRTLSTHTHESYLQAQRQRQDTPEFKAQYRIRSRVEHKQAELVQHGLRHTRYVGDPKRQLQRLWTGAAVNLKNLFRVADVKQVDLRRTWPGVAVSTA